MGYSTNYKLYASDSDVLKALIDDGSLEYMYLQKPGMGEPCARLEGKWYEHEVDLRNVSAENPGVLFTLHGAGEGAGDLWRKYFLNGKMQEAPARIEYDDFDTEKLT